MSVICKTTGAKAIAHMMAFVGKEISANVGSIQIAYREYRDDMQSDEKVITQSIYELIENNPTIAVKVASLMKELFELLVEPIVNPMEVEDVQPKE